MKNVCFRAIMRHGCLQQHQEGIACPSFVVSEAKHFFFCWLFRICAISHMCTSLVSSKAVAHISITCVLLSAEIHNTRKYAPDDFIWLALTSFPHLPFKTFSSTYNIKAFRTPSSKAFSLSLSLYCWHGRLLFASLVEDDLEPLSTWQLG